MVKQILEWAKKVNLIEKSNIYAQGIKFIEEVGETADAYRKRNREELLDGFGDMVVVATIMLAMRNIPTQIIEASFEDSINHDHQWITDTGVVSFDTLLNQALQFKLDVNAHPPRAIMPYRNLVSACNTFIIYETNGNENLKSVLEKKVLKTINSRIDGIIVDDRGFAIKAEDRA